MLRGGRWEGGSCLGTHVRIKDFKIILKKASKKFFICMCEHTLGGQIPKSIIVCEDVLTYSFECVLSLVFLEKESMFMIQNSFKMRKE